MKELKPTFIVEATVLRHQPSGLTVPLKDRTPATIESQLKNLRQLVRQKERTANCRECRGTGRATEQGRLYGDPSITTPCPECRG